jgi:hypothetical protein
MDSTVIFKDFESEWLTDILADNPSTLEKGRRFAKKLIEQWLDFNGENESPDDIVYCDGSGDGGIDIAYLQRGDNEDENDKDKEGDTWYLVQSKYGKAFQGTNTLLQEAQKLIDTLDNKRTNLSSLAENLVQRLQTFRSNASNIDKIVLVFATQRPLNNDEKRVVEDIRAMGKSRLGINFETESISIENIYNRILETVSIVNKNKVNITADLVPSGEELLVGSIGIQQLFEFLKNYRTKTGDIDMLYEKNVRKFLGPKRKVNKGIEKTLLEKPERFGLYNNGITVVVEEFEKFPNNIEYCLTEPYVVNGCQTTRTIWDVLLKKLEAGGTGKNDELEKWKEKLNQGIVVIKIVKVGAKGEELLKETTKYTNSQNAVSDKDFIALEDDFRKWSESMANRYDVFLEIQRGGWEAQKAYQKQNPDAKAFKEYVNAFDLLKVYGAAWFREAGTAFGKNPPFSPGGTIFHRTVNLPDFGIEDLYAGFLLCKAGRGRQFTFVQTRYLFYMLVIELLKDCFIPAEQPATEKNITKVLLELFKPKNKDLLDALLKFANQIADDYLEPDNDYSVFKEPKFIEKGRNINAFLGWEQLGKSIDATPLLNNLITQYKIAMKGGIAGVPKYRDLIKEVIVRVCR